MTARSSRAARPPPRLPGTKPISTPRDRAMRHLLASAARAAADHA